MLVPIANGTVNKYYYPSVMPYLGVKKDYTWPWLTPVRTEENDIECHFCTKLTIIAHFTQCRLTYCDDESKRDRLNQMSTILGCAIPFYSCPHVAYFNKQVIAQVILWHWMQAAAIQAMIEPCLKWSNTNAPIALHSFQNRDSSRLYQGYWIPYTRCPHIWDIEWPESNERESCNSVK